MIPVCADGREGEGGGTFTLLCVSTLNENNQQKASDDSGLDIDSKRKLMHATKYN